MNRSYTCVALEAISTTPRTALVRQVCDTFIELRRERAFLGTSELIGGFARIGNHSVLIMIHSKDGQRGSRRPLALDAARVNGYRKAQHLMQLAHKFNRPVIVFLTSTMSLPGKGIAKPQEAFGFTRHILSQWQLEVPMILVVLNKRSSADIFGAWLADKILALEQARFSMTILGHRKSRRVQVEAKHLLDEGVIDRIIAEPFMDLYESKSRTPNPLRSALNELLDELTHMSSKELMTRRREKLERLSAITLEHCWQGK